MDNQKHLFNELKQAIGFLEKKIEFEQYFSPELISCGSSTDEKNSKVSRLYQKVRQCMRCSLYKIRTNVVFGDGDLNADIVFVGEAPGRDEDLTGKPFVGVAGELLTKIIQAMGTKREKVYITNILRCRPPSNRNPLPEEIVCCRPYLLNLLEIIRPKLICTLGRVASCALLGDSSPISKLRGKFFDFKGIKLMPTFHPAYLLRNPADKKLVWHDVKKIMEYIKNDEAGKTN